MFGANLAFGGQYFCKDSFVHNKGASHLPHMEWLAVTFLEAAALFPMIHSYAIQKNTGLSNVMVYIDRMPHKVTKLGWRWFAIACEGKPTLGPDSGLRRMNSPSVQSWRPPWHRLRGANVSKGRLGQQNLFGAKYVGWDPSFQWTVPHQWSNKCDSWAQLTCSMFLKDISFVT